MDVSIVVPLLNEEESLPELAAWIRRVAEAARWEYEVIFVDDGSTDRSWAVIEDIRKENPHVKGIRFTRNYGKSAALHMGFQAALGEVVITMDADLQDSPDELPELRRLIVEERYDLVSGWKQKRYDPIAKTIPSKFFNWITRKVSGINNLHDFNCGLKSYRRDVVKNIEVYGEMHRYIPLLAKWAGFPRIGEKVVEHRARKYGVTKFGLNRFINGFLDLVTIVFTHRYLKQPMHFFGTWGVFFALLGGGTLLYLAAVKVLLGQGLGNRIPAFMFGTVTFLLGMTLFSTGLLGELITRNAPDRNAYRVRTQIGLGQEPHSAPQSINTLS